MLLDEEQEEGKSFEKTFLSELGEIRVSEGSLHIRRPGSLEGFNSGLNKDLNFNNEDESPRMPQVTH
jgi:hypothetical protein